MDWDNVEDAAEGTEFAVIFIADGSDPQPPDTFPVIRLGGPRDGDIIGWAQVKKGVRRPQRVLMSTTEAFVEYDEEGGELT
jgi:hypothetical protein